MEKTQSQKWTWFAAHVPHLHDWERGSIISFNRPLSLYPSIRFFICVSENLWRTMKTWRSYLWTEEGFCVFSESGGMIAALVFWVFGSVFPKRVWCSASSASERFWFFSRERVSWKWNSYRLASVEDFFLAEKERFDVFLPQQRPYPCLLSTFHFVSSTWSYSSQQHGRGSRATLFHSGKQRVSILLLWDVGDRDFWILWSKIRPENLWCIPLGSIGCSGKEVEEESEKTCTE